MIKFILAVLLTSAGSYIFAQDISIPAEKITTIVVEYKTGRRLLLDCTENKIEITEPDQFKVIRTTTHGIPPDVTRKFVNDIVNIINTGSSAGMFTKLPLDHVVISIHFNGPVLKFLPLNDNTADEIDKFFKGISLAIAEP